MQELSLLMDDARVAIARPFCSGLGAGNQRLLPSIVPYRCARSWEWQSCMESTAPGRHRSSADPGMRPHRHLNMLQVTVDTALWSILLWGRK